MKVRLYEGPCFVLRGDYVMYFEVRGNHRGFACLTSYANFGGKIGDMFTDFLFLIF